jgi:SAM-dependent methyltransferase
MTDTTIATNPNQALWEKGDFTKLAATMRGSGAALVRAIGIKPGDKVLDLGCGDGTTAIPAAELGAEVLGVDIARNLVDAGNRRVAAVGLKNIRFQQGDASQLTGIADAHFDHVVSIFGAMFAPRPVDVAKEMVRVTKPGGRITMGNWIPGDPTLVAQILKISAAYSPPPPEGFVSPVRWGVEADVRERFAAAGIPDAQVRASGTRMCSISPARRRHFLEVFRDLLRPDDECLRGGLGERQGGRAAGELEALFAAQNTSKTPDRTTIPATFLRVSVQV